MRESLEEHDIILDESQIAQFEGVLIGTKGDITDLIELFESTAPEGMVLDHNSIETDAYKGSVRIRGMFYRLREIA